MPSPIRILHVLICAVLGVTPLHAQLSPAAKSAVGYNDLVLRLGAGAPTGAGVSVTQVEAPQGGNYRPNVLDGQLSLDSFVFPSPPPTAASSHATRVAKHLYGTQSLSPGAGNAPAEVRSYEAANWLLNGFLSI